MEQRPNEKKKNEEKKNSKFRQIGKEQKSMKHMNAREKRNEIQKLIYLYM